MVNGTQGISSIVVVAVVLTTGVRAAEPELIAELGSRQVYEGESVDYTVFLNNVEDAAELQLNGFTDFEVRFRGQSREDQEAQYIINGRKTVIRRHGFKYVYTLTPRGTGTLKVPAPMAEVDGQKVVGNSCQLVVGEITPQDVAILELSADPPSVYMTQPFTVTLKVAVKGIGSEYREINPMVGVSRQPPQLRFAWADDDQLPTGITAETPADRWLRSLRASSGNGFAVNDYREATSIFSLGFDMNSRGRAMGFLPTARRIQRPDLDGKETEYWEFSFVREFTSAEVGQFSFGPVTLKGTFAVSSGSFDRPRGEDVIAVAKPITIEVKDAPVEGRPDSYVGGVGQFEVDSQLTPTEVRVGEPMTLALSITGRGTLDRIAAPDLSAVAEIEKDFKIYDSTTETRRNGKSFTYSLRPRTAGIAEFPSIPISYFDAKNETYVTLQTDSIPVQVAVAEKLSASQIAMSNGQLRAEANLEASSEGIFANITQPSAFVDQSVHPGRWVFGMGSLAGVYALTALVATRVQRQSSDHRRVRRRRAASRARKRLAEATSTLQSGPRGAADLFRGVFVGFVADIADVPEAGLTPSDVRSQLEQLQFPDALIVQCTDVLQKCDHARYGAGGELAVVDQEAHSLLNELLIECRRRKLLS